MEHLNASNMTGCLVSLVMVNAMRLLGHMLVPFKVPWESGLLSSSRVFVYSKPPFDIGNPTKTSEKNPTGLLSLAFAFFGKEGEKYGQWPTVECGWCV